MQLVKSLQQSQNVPCQKLYMNGPLFENDYHEANTGCEHENSYDASFD